MLEEGEEEENKAGRASDPEERERQRSVRTIEKETRKDFNSCRRSFVSFKATITISFPHFLNEKVCFLRMTDDLALLFHP